MYLKLNPLNFKSPAEHIASKPTIPELSKNLRQFGCNGCGLCGQEGLAGPVVYRGNPNCKCMVIGEAPGRDEDKTGLPFTGPAGQLMDKIFASQGWDTNTDWYIGNVVKCRPIAERGSGRENLTPTKAHTAACYDYIKYEISVIQPELIVLTGATAANVIIPETKGMKMAELAGTVWFSEAWAGITPFFIMYHPAAILHAQPWPEKYAELRKASWDHIKILKAMTEEMKHG
jgi:uracil-DNA glycosylase family 4